MPAHFGYTLLGEQAGPRQLIDDAGRAERAGFDFAVISDHFSPWLATQGHAPFAWAVLGAVAHATERMGLVSFVTCPLRRYHPAVVAQMAATVGVISQGRFTLGIGAGENLNEHVVGAWPHITERHHMLIEALEIIRPLLDGATVHFEGRYFQVPEARLYDLPEGGVPVAVAASGPASAEIAADYGDAVIAVEPDRTVVERFAGRSGREDRPRYGQVAICYGPDEQECRKTALEQWRWAALGWPVLAELPELAAFEAASRNIREEDVAAKVPCGPDLDRHVAAVRRFLEAGFTHVALVQVGAERQAEFLDWAERDLLPALRDSHPAPPDSHPAGHSD
jgi:G6PDH family F420-dependent oxidoreductase